MAIELVLEKETGSLTTDSVPYYVRDTAVAKLTKADAVAAVLAQAFIDQGVLATDYRWERRSAQVGRCTVQYRTFTNSLSPLTPPTLGTTEWGFNFQMGTTELLYSLNRTKYPGTAPDFAGLINVPSGGETYDARGLKLTPPPEKFWVRWYAPTASVSTTYVNVVAGMVGTTNLSTFNGYPSGSLVLVRASGAPRDNESWTIYFGFGYEPQVAHSIGSHSFTADGFQHVWGYYHRKIFTESGKDLMVLDPTYVYQDDVIPEGNFGILGI